MSGTLDYSWNDSDSIFRVNSSRWSNLYSALIYSGSTWARDFQVLDRSLFDPPTRPIPVRPTYVSRPLSKPMILHLSIRILSLHTQPFRCRVTFSLSKRDEWQAGCLERISQIPEGWSWCKQSQIARFKALRAYIQMKPFFNNRRVSEQTKLEGFKAVFRSQLTYKFPIWVSFPHIDTRESRNFLDSWGTRKS